MPEESETYQAYERSIAKICDAEGTTVYGSGFLVSERFLITCAHVVTTALREDRYLEERPKGLIYIQFPYSRYDRDLLIPARAQFWWPERETPSEIEDVAGLILLEEPPDDACPAPIQAIQTVEPSFLQEYSLRAIGFPEGCDDTGESIEATPQQRLPTGWIQIVGNIGPGVEEGYSGAPVWGQKYDESGGVVGMIIAKEKDLNRTAFMILQQDLPILKQSDLYELLECFIREERKLLHLGESAYQRSLPVSRSKTQPTSAWEIINNLKGFPCLDEEKYSPLIKYMGFISLTESLSPKLRRNIDNWIEVCGVNVGELQAWVEQQRNDNPLEDTLSIQGSSYLMIVVREPALSDRSTTYEIFAWFIRDSQAYKPLEGQGLEPIHLTKPTVKRPKASNASEEDEFTSEMRQQVFCAYKQIKNRCHDLTIEIYLPQEQLNHAVDSWLMPPYRPIDPSFGTYFKLVIRSSYRLSEYYYADDDWRDKWLEIQRKRDSPAYEILKPIADSLKFNQAVSLFQDRSQDKRVLGVRLPDAVETGEESLIEAVVTTGVPIAFWLRRSLPRRNSYQTEINRVLQCKLHKTTENVRALRNEAYGEHCPVAHQDDDPVGHHISLMWEDWNRQPPKPHIVPMN